MKASKDELRQIILALNRIIKDNGEENLSKRLARRYHEIVSVFNVV